MIKLHYIYPYEQVTKYHNDIIHLAETLGYNKFYKHPIGDHYYFPVEMFNKMVDWLITNYPEEFTLG